ncbi:MAG: MFS transporter [Anaerolineae bacterium]
MNHDLRWRDYIVMNLYVFGISFATGSITPLLLPYLVALFVPDADKNTYLATVRVVSLAVAMLVQPLAGLLSDRSPHPWGRRRPFIVGATLFSVLFLILVGASPLLEGSGLDAALRPALGVTVAYVALLLGIVLLQASTNVGQAAVQGLIPDLVPERQRGRASGIKAVMELLPAFPIIAVGWLVGNDQVGLTVALIVAVFVVTMLVTVLGVREEPLARRPEGGIRDHVLRLVALTIIFVATTRAGVWLVSNSGRLLAGLGAGVGVQVVVVGLAGLLGMAGSILIGVYLGARVGIGRGESGQGSFIWWVINRLLFLAAVGSIQGFALYYLRDVLQLADAEQWTSVLLAFVAIFLVTSALGGGVLSDRLGRKRLVALSGLVAAGGTFLLLLADGLPLVIVSGSIIGLGTGTFMASNWALGTELAPPAEAGRYLGIANLAGAGAGIVGAGIGGPLADFLNQVEPGLGYLVIFALYGGLFLLSVLSLVKVDSGY